MQIKTRLLRWAGPVAIGGGVFAAVSAMSGLSVRLPFLVAPTGYDVVGTGLLLIAMTLLMVGMIGLYIRQPERGAKVIERGGPGLRYIPENREESPEDILEAELSDLVAGMSASKECVR